VLEALTRGYQLALFLAACAVILGTVLCPFLLRTDESPEEQAARIKENMATPEAQEHLII
jgi:hypothetical protein